MKRNFGKFHKGAKHKDFAGFALPQSNTPVGNKKTPKRGVNNGGERLCWYMRPCQLCWNTFPVKQMESIGSVYKESVIPLTVCKGCYDRLESGDILVPDKDGIDFHIEQEPHIFPSLR